MRGFDFAMLCFVRGEFAIVEQHDLPNRSGFVHLDCLLENLGRYQLFVVDIGPNAFYPKRNRLAQIREAAATTGERTIIVGDFNTPWESALFDPWREQFTHADDAAGYGFRETWRAPFPLLAIDHMWCSRDLIANGFKKVNAIRSSDHACLIGDFASHETALPRRSL